MKNIFRILGSCIGITLIVIFIYVIWFFFNYQEDLRINVNNNTRIIFESTNTSISEAEIDLLEEALKDDSVLNIFVQTNEKVESKNIEHYIDFYTNADVPYVIFFYNDDINTLKSVSYDVIFEDISVENAKYTDVYKYIPNINSNRKIISAYQSKSAIFVLICIIIGLLYLVICNIKTIVKSLKWNKTFDAVLCYKRTFFGNNLKVKLNKDNKNKDKIAYVITNVKSKKDCFIFTLNTINVNNIYLCVTYKNGTYKYYKYKYNPIFKDNSDLNYVYLSASSSI